MNAHIGIGTYALFWEWSQRNPTPISLENMIRRAHDLDCGWFQICDYPPIEQMDRARLRDVRQLADELGIALELGTRGTGDLGRYLDIAAELDAHVLRSMVDEASRESEVEALLPRLAEQDVKLAFETYEKCSSSRLVEFVDSFGDPRVGIALDPANSVAGLEVPRDVIDRCADRVTNLHVKDFAFSRLEGWIGFQLAGCPLGEGLLDLDRELAAVRPVERGITMIVEHWLVWQGSIEATLATEQEWTIRALETLRAGLATAEPQARR